MGGCGNWDLAEARGYREAFVDRLMRTSQVEVNGKVYHPWSFYYSVSQMIVRERRREMARETAAKLRDLEAAYLSQLQQKQFQGTARVVNADLPSLGIKDALAKPTGWDDSPPWRSGTDGQLQFAVGGYDLSPAATLLLTIKAPGSPPRMFAIPRHLLKEVTP